MKVGRNDPCPCGSGRKFKFCHLNMADIGTLPKSRIAPPLPDHVREKFEKHRIAELIRERTYGKVREPLHIGEHAGHRLVLRPHEEVLIVIERLARFLARKPPIDGHLVTVHPAIPGARLKLKVSQTGDSTLAQALASEETDFDFRLIEPTAVARRVMHRESAPNLVAYLGSENVGQ